MIFLDVWINFSLCTMLRVWPIITYSWTATANLASSHINLFSFILILLYGIIQKQIRQLTYTMIILLLFSSPLHFTAIILSLLVAITFHEFAHSWAANSFGDSTSKLMGRMSLNPLAHLDIYGSIFLLLVGFGWGKPVIVNPNNFANPKLDNLTVSLAGPMSNLILAVVFGLILRLVPMPEIVSLFISALVFFNLLLMVFNFLPIPPLDGSKILSLFLPEQIYLFLQQFGMFILVFVIFFTGLISLIETKVIFNFFIFITARPDMLSALLNL
ncbi:MAG: peptidase [Candidatus Berkelbacteria bacterium]|nr:peptidase [Candidatus Berkelbacteria bacterium]